MPKLTIKESLKRLCSALQKYDVYYMVIGGTAVGFHGYNRVSITSQNYIELDYDLDFWYKPSIENYYNLITALKETGVDVSPLNDVVFSPDKAYLRIPYENHKAEFLPILTGLNSFDQCFNRSITVVIENVAIRVIGYVDLIENKKVLNRDIDARDINELENRKKEKGSSK